MNPTPTLGGIRILLVNKYPSLWWIICSQLSSLTLWLLRWCVKLRSKEPSINRVLQLDITGLTVKLSEIQGLFLYFWQGVSVFQPAQTWWGQQSWLVKFNNGYYECSWPSRMVVVVETVLQLAKDKGRGGGKGEFGSMSMKGVWRRLINTDKRK